MDRRDRKGTLERQGHKALWASKVHKDCLDRLVILGIQEHKDQLARRVLRGHLQLVLIMETQQFWERMAWFSSRLRVCCCLRRRFHLLMGLARPE